MNSSLGGTSGNVHQYQRANSTRNRVIIHGGKNPKFTENIQNLEKNRKINNLASRIFTQTTSNINGTTVVPCLKPGDLIRTNASTRTGRQEIAEQTQALEDAKKAM